MAKKAKTKAAKAKKVAPKAVAAKKAKARTAKTVAKKGFKPPYKCQKTLVAGACLKYFYNPNSGAYDLGGDRVDCGSCEYFM